MRDCLWLGCASHVVAVVCGVPIVVSADYALRCAFFLFVG